MPNRGGSGSDWNMPESDRAKLAEEMNRAAMGTADPGDVQALVDRFGRRTLAEKWAALRGTKVASQMRNIQRYIKGDRKMDKMRDAVEDTSRGMAAQSIRDRGSVRFEFTATFTISKTKWTGKASGTLSGPALDAFADAIANGEHELAAKIAAGRYFDDPDMVSSVNNVQGMRF
jgi:hypothetical protein